MKTNDEISVSKNGQFAQIVHNNNFYLATVSSNLHSRRGTVDYFDYYDWLLFYGRIRDHTDIQIFNPFQSDNLQLQKTIRFCRQQTNVVDCRN